MKLFDRVSEDARKVLDQVEDLSPSEVTWGYSGNWTCPITKELEAFIVHGRRLDCHSSDEYSYVHVAFTRNVSDGVLKTDIHATDGRVSLDVYLERGREDVLWITKLEFRNNTHNESPKTVRHVHDWVRGISRPYFMKAKDAHDSEAGMRDRLRDKYKP